MEQYVIRGGNPLVGEVEIGGAKNAALAILTAATMTDETVLIENLPDVSDINVLLEAIAEIGATVDRIDRHTVRINAATIGDLSVDYEYIKKIGWGHSTINMAITNAKLSNSKILCITHHDIYKNDKSLDEELEKSKQDYPSIIFARENLEIKI